VNNPRILLIVGFVTVFLFGIFVGINIRSAPKTETLPDPSPLLPTDTSSCVYDGKTYQQGESFKDKDGCNSCGCEKGEVACTMMACE